MIKVALKYSGNRKPVIQGIQRVSRPGQRTYVDHAHIPKIQGGLAAYISGSLVIAASSGAATTTAQAQITDLLRERHHTRPGAEDDFSIRNLAELASAQQEGTKTMTTLLASVAAVSLLVGGIGIMNIMLVSVTERTREIGLRMALGARGRDILKQFLVEAVTLSMIGGALGIALGVITSFAVGEFANWSIDITPQAIALAVGFSAAVGVFFGFYPASKASRLLPIEALRYE